MAIEISRNGDVVTASFAGEVDGRTAPPLLKEIAGYLKGGDKLMLDLVGVTYMSSAGLRMLITLYRQLHAERGRIILVGLSSEIREVMTHTGFISYFTIVGTREEAEASFRGDK